MLFHRETLSQNIPHTPKKGQAERLCISTDEGEMELGEKENSLRQEQWEGSWMTYGTQRLDHVGLSSQEDE